MTNNSNINYEDWFKKIREASNVVKKEEKQGIEKKPKDVPNVEKNKKRFILPFVIFFMALIPRLIFLFSNNPQNAGPGWYGDVYHHWQIAYLSKTVGFSEGFLRLWDLKGMEFFWGLAHPLVLIILFTVFQSVNILIPRLLSVFAGSVIAVFIFFIIKRDFGKTAGIAAGIWTSFFSVVLFSDTLGMQEQLGLFFLLGGILAWPKKAWLTGLLWFFASMTRSEYWLFSIMLVFASLFDRRNVSASKIALAASYLFPIIFYMKYLVNWTNNPIFPIYWNFLASVKGEWFTNVGDPLNPIQIQGQWFGRFLFITGAIGTFITFFKRSKAFLFFLLGFFNVTFIGFMFGFGAYIHGFFDRFFVDRLLAFPYLFLGLLVFLLFIYLLPKHVSALKNISVFLGILFLLIILLVSQLAWFKMMHYFRSAQDAYKIELDDASFIAKNYQEGKILFPAGRPTLTYALVYNHKVSGDKLISDMYDPFFYASSEAPEKTQKKMINWLKKEKIKLIIFNGKDEYKKLFASYPDDFKLLEQRRLGLYEFLR